VNRRITFDRNRPAAKTISFKTAVTTVVALFVGLCLMTGLSSCLNQGKEMGTEVTQ
jgi:hypothetical protein